MVQNNDLPSDVRAQFRLTRELKGGPVFDFPSLPLRGVCFAEAVPDNYPRRAVVITPAIAERLLRAGWPGIERVNTWEEKAPAPPKNRKSQLEYETYLPAEADATAGKG